MPVESLHTLLLGPYKYLLRSTIPTLSQEQKAEVLAKIRAFNYSGFECRLLGNVIYHHQSFVGRDYKAWAQIYHVALPVSWRQGSVDGFVKGK